MMRAIFKLFPLLFLFSYIVPDDGAGGGEMEDIGKEIDDIGDMELDDIEDEDIEKEEDKDKEEPKSKNEVEELKRELEELKKDKQERENEKAVQSAVSEIKSKYDDFDIEKIKSYLIELKKTDPDKAEMLNSPLGWENIHLTQIRAKEVKNDSTAYGRNVKPVDRSEEIDEKIQNGDFLSINDEASYFGNLL